ncbi:protein PLANT CADMIUM RESISTANCE 7 [Cryptomeria japonica]|uniref:protein PLANT CADMIUM RESISTANCE 7 n=1 Tax=Cryptomeria japonica TaxID=3369 RepID=UPI0027DA3CEF|nr:protein PLANT CADMIUM RESISTANCE 7 [Cryptomeria japonica]
MQASKAERGAQAYATPFPEYHPPQQIAAGFPLPPQNFASAPQQYVHPLAPQPYPQQGGPLRPTEWSSGLCACCADQSVCCLTCWCPCITFGQIAEIVDEGSPSCCANGGIYGALLCLTGLACCYSCLYRTKIRAKFNLSDCWNMKYTIGPTKTFDSDLVLKQWVNTDMPCADCVVHGCCESCALCQEYRELKHRGFHPALGWEGNLRRQQPGMGTAMAAPAYPMMAR